MEHIYRTKGTCSREISFELDGDKVRNVHFVGGCDGNLKGIGPAGQPAGAQAAGLCEEPAGCRPLAVSGGSTEEPKNRAAG